MNSELMLLFPLCDLFSMAFSLFVPLMVAYVTIYISGRRIRIS